MSKFLIAPQNIVYVICFEDVMLRAWNIPLGGWIQAVEEVSGAWLSRKQAFSNILKISPPKTESFQIKILIFFIFLLKNIDCVYSLEPPRPAEKEEK